MLSRPQQIKLKMAQSEAGLSDDEYRDALQIVTGCRSSTAPALTDRDFDKLLSYFEAIHWHAVDAGKLQRSSRTNAVFRQRGYWSQKNNREETSRDRFNGVNLKAGISSAENQLAALGFGADYCAGIRKNVTKGRDDDHALHLYLTALTRTLNAKTRRADRAVVSE